MTQDTLPDGREVVTRTPAKLSVPLRDEPVPIGTIDEVLLVDGSVVFQCVHPGLVDNEPCTYVSDNGVSVRAHQKIHGKVAQMRRAQRELETVRTELEQRIQRRSEGAKRAAQTRLTQRANGRTDKHVSSPTDASPTDATAVDHALAQLEKMICSLADQLPAITLEIGVIRAAVRELPNVDPSVLAKAQQFDALRGMFRE